MNPISIPTPCHENWDAMTPTQQGAFCQKCSTDVVDFSQRTNREILQFLKENHGKHVCGRFQKQQLDDFNESYLEWENQNSRTFQSKFLYACLLVFGMSLFNGYSQQEEMILGQMMVPTTYSQAAAAGSNLEQPAISTQETAAPEDSFRKGKVKYDPNKTNNSTCEPTEHYIKGEIYIPEKTQDSLKTATFSDTAQHRGISANPQPIKAVNSDPVSDQPADENVDSETTRELAVGTETIAVYKPTFSALLYPNPSASNTVLLLDVAQDGMYTVSLYNSAGQEVLNVYSGQLQIGRTNLLINCSDLQSGNYYVRITGGKQIEIYQLVISK